jgi:hypothetical protein
VCAGSQLPLASPRSDARQNLIDALTCATAAFTPPHMALNEVAVCFGGKLMRGNRAQKVNSSNYQVRTDTAAFKRANQLLQLCCCLVRKWLAFLYLPTRRRTWRSMEPLCALRAN